MPTRASDSPSSEQPSLTAEPAVLTEADNGRMLTLHVGDEVALRLSHDPAWGEPTVEGAAVEVAPVDYLVDPGFTEWRITAVAAGTGVVSVAGDPPATVEFEFRVTG